jgi:hypothetical protein
MVAGS